ncbi:YegP family protein [Enterovirga aerilata]|uniref:DUF1508 domain-containing protein n=1 Tax=Enterovirga aerilata TaxID=2730920 RepID=A0A849IKF5_9HYPH|nr:DUF1508 domain-containing protein [Enterovirga sp. DB1703]NNM74423.1 DUF1508 domain-containing protein [Enterovirga sp. DB1703]
MRFEIYKGHNGEWRWRLRVQNGNVIADSAEGYERRSDCERGIELVKTSAAAPVVDMSAKIAGGQHRAG